MLGDAFNFNMKTVVKTGIYIVLVQILVAQGTALHSKEPPEKQDAQRKRTVPFIGKVIEDGAVYGDPDQNSVKLQEFSSGTLVVVEGEKEEWFRLAPVQEIPLWIPGNSAVKEGNTVMVRERNVPLYSRPGDVNGEYVVTVTTINQHFDMIREQNVGKGSERSKVWYEVPMPPALSVWMKKEKVRYEHPDKLKYRKELPGKAGERAKRMWKRKALRKRFEEIVSQVMDALETSGEALSFEDILRSLDELQKESSFKEINERASSLKNVLNSVDKEVRKEQKKLHRKLEEIEKLREKWKKRGALLSQSYLATGYVDSYGNVIGRPADYILEKGGETLFFLKGNDNIDLGSYLFKYVGIQGEVIGQDSSRRIVKVDRVVILQSDSKSSR